MKKLQTLHSTHRETMTLVSKISEESEKSAKDIMAMMEPLASAITITEKEKDAVSKTMFKCLQLAFANGGRCALAMYNKQMNDL